MERKYTSTRLTDEMPTHLRERARSFRLAFAVIGELIADGFIEIDFARENWAEMFELAVIDVAEQLNSFEN